MNLPTTLKRLLGMSLALVASVASIHAATARRLVDLNPGSVGSYPSNFTAYSGNVYFSAYTLPTGMELWRYNGTEVTLAADINDTADDIGSGVKEGNDSLPDWLIEYGGKLYFSAFDSRRGAELWRFDGNQASRVSDINPDESDVIKAMSNSAWPNQIVHFNDALYFSANSNTMPENYELWKYDGVSARQVADLHPQAGTNHSSYPTGLTVFNGALYFMADDGSHGWELWRHQGSETMLIDIHPGGAESSSYPKGFTGFNNELFFQAYTVEEGFELWKTDGATATLVSDYFAGPESSYPKEMIIFNRALYLTASDATHGAELRTYNGIEIALAADINPNGDSSPKNLTILGNMLVFAANDGEHGWELWKFDGTNASMVVDLNPVGDAFPENLTLHDGALFFSATTPETGYELWKFDGTNVTPVLDANPGPGDSFPRFLTSIGGQLFFSAADEGFSNWEVWLYGADIMNLPPTVSLTGPTNGSAFSATESVEVSATANDDFGVTRVEYYSGTTLLGTDIEAPFSISVLFAAGNHSLIAKAIDTGGLSTTSTPVTITVSDSNGPPSIVITSPTSGATFLSTESILISADASDDTGISSVEFFNGGVSLGVVTSAPYSINLSLPVGLHTLTAVATDVAGATTTSASVNITVSQASSEKPQIQRVARVELTTSIVVNTSSAGPHVLEVSPDLKSWYSVATNSPAGGSLTFTHATLDPHQFYRVLVPR